MCFDFGVENYFLLVDHFLLDQYSSESAEKGLKVAYSEKNSFYGQYFRYLPFFAKL